MYEDTETWRVHRTLARKSDVYRKEQDVMGKHLHILHQVSKI